MDYRVQGNDIIVFEPDLDLDETLDCGQAFRWKKIPSDYISTYEGAFLNDKLKVSQTDKGSFIFHDTDENDFISKWINYFDFETDYSELKRCFSEDETLAKAVNFAGGIRLLRQDSWECLISFIISQCNNIPRIQGIISRLCALYGEIIDGGFAFPTPEALSCLSIEDLAPLRCGYRAPYILSSAQAVSGRSLDLSALESANTETILRALLALPGVGIKVASCVLLFGFHRLEAFPVDTWIRKALKQDYGLDFDPAKAFGPYAGIAQQYIFYHARGKNLA